jgi:hypothetical protein
MDSLALMNGESEGRRKGGLKGETTDGGKMG